MIYAFIGLFVLICYVFLKVKIDVNNFESLINYFMKKRVMLFKVRNLENHASNESEMIEFLELQEKKLLKNDFGLFNRIIFIFLRNITNYKMSDYRAIVLKFHNDEIFKIIQQDLIYKEFYKISSNIHFELTDWVFIINKPRILYQAYRRGFVNKEIIDKLINDVKNSKTDYSDEITSRNLNKIQYDVINLLTDLKNLKQEI
jgi:hypothetical protein